MDNTEIEIGHCERSVMVKIQQALFTPTDVEQDEQPARPASAIRCVYQRNNRPTHATGVKTKTEAYLSKKRKHQLYGAAGSTANATLRETAS